MSSHLMPFVVMWSVLAVAVIGMIFWRKAVAAHEDDSLHVSQTAAAREQVSVNHKLEMIDKWGKILTIIAVVTGLILASLYFYQVWTASSSIGV